MMVERIFDLLTLVFLFFLSAAFLFHEISNSAIAFYSLVLVIVFFTILFILLLFFPMIVNRIAVSLINRLPIQSNRKQKFSAVIQKFFQSIQKVHSSKALTVIFLFSIIATTLEVLRLFVIFDHIGAEKSFILLTFGLSMGMLVGLAALIPGGIGVSEVTESKVIDTLNGTDTSTSVTSSAVLIDRLFAYYFLVLLGSLILLFSKKLFIPIHETGEDDTKEDDETREDEGSAEST